jgi:hypothetical protein
MFMRFADARAFPADRLVRDSLTLICLVGFLNAVNMADGKNGLVIGQALIWSARARMAASLSAAASAGSLGHGAGGAVRLQHARPPIPGDSVSYGLSAALGCWPSWRGTTASPI